MQEQIIETWYINNRVNLKLIDVIRDEGFECTLSKRGGRNVALQFAHVHNLRLWRMERYAPEYLNSQTQIDREGRINRDLLKKRFVESADATAAGLKRV